jgi:hypothetical protein
MELFRLRISDPRFDQFAGWFKMFPDYNTLINNAIITASSGEKVFWAALPTILSL